MVQVEKFTIARNDDFMEGWPDLIRLQSGRVLVVYNECIAHTNRDHTHIALRKSDDGGKTWSEKQYIGEETQNGQHWNSIRFSQLKNGKIVLVCDKVSRSEKSAETKCYAFESLDDGDTWSEKRDINVYGYCSDKVRELSDGSLLLCVSRYNDQSGKTEVFAHKSYDGGENWTGPVLAAQSEQYTFIEPAALELKNGKVAVFLRENSLKGYNGFVVLSEDKGKSFGPLRELPVKGMHRPFVGYLSDGTILLSYREHLSSDQPYRDLKLCVMPEAAVLAPEQAKLGSVLIDQDGSENPDQGYSAWTQMDDGSILMANYIVDDAPFAYIRGYRIRIGEENA